MSVTTVTYKDDASVKYEHYFHVSKRKQERSINREKNGLVSRGLKVARSIAQLTGLAKVTATLQN